LELIGGGPIRVADAAHCPLSARAAVQAKSEHFPGRPVILALGLLRDKGVAGILQELAALPKVVEVFVHEPNSPRALPSAELHGAVKARFQNVEDKGTVERAIDAALESQSRNPNAVLLSTGSFYSLAQARKRLSAAG
jgi:folylpolyglutamate synthase/dihydropteroate synthase